MGRNRNQFGCLYKNGRLYWLKYVDANGKEHRVSTKTDNKSAAEKFRKNLLQHNAFDDTKHALEVVKMQLEEITPKTTQPKDNPIKIIDMVEVFENDVNTSGITASTFRLYHSRVNGLCNFVAKEKSVIDINNVFAYMVDNRLAEKYMLYLRRKLTPNTYNNYLAAFNKLWRVCMKKDNNITTNPFLKENFSYLKSSKKKTRLDFTEEDIKKIQDYVKHNEDFCYQVLFNLGIYTGMRLIDCCTLKWSDVDLDTGFIRKIPQKTQRNGIKAIIPIHPILREMFNQLPIDYDYVLPDIKKLSHKYISDKIRKIFDKCGFKRTVVDDDGKIHPQYGFHCFRIHFASKCMRSGMNIRQIQTMLCHTSAEMSLSYMQVNEADLKLPNLDTELVGVRLERKLFDRIMAQAGVNETISDVVARLLQQIEQKQTTEEIDRRRNNVMIALANKYGIITTKEYYDYIQNSTPITLTVDQIRQIKLHQENDTF